MQQAASKALIAIACGGTGGHLFPGIAVGQQLLQRGCEILLLVSEKGIDQQAIKSAQGMRIASLPAVGLQAGQLGRFLTGFTKSFIAVRRIFSKRPPRSVIGMGGFACAPPIIAGKLFRAHTFLHESNSVPGKANRWLAPLVDQVFVGFPQAANRMQNRQALVTGTPVRPQFELTDPEPCRLALGLDPNRPVLLVMGGSQGASAINGLVFEALPELKHATPQLQFLHLAGPNDEEKARAQYAAQNLKSVVRTFLTEMELALGAATIAVSRAGASSLAELAAMQVPAILIPYPTAADNHQFYNAHAFASAGAAIRLEQGEATGEKLASLIIRLLQDPSKCSDMKTAVRGWHTSNAATLIAEQILSSINLKSSAPNFGSAVSGAFQPATL